MKAQFNGTCGHCRTFQPRCALVRLTEAGGKVVRWSPYVVLTLCDTCREALKGMYHLEEQHK